MAKKAGKPTLDSGNRQQFETGAQRDTEEGKPRFQLVPLWLLDSQQASAGGTPATVDRVDAPIVLALPDEDKRYDLITDQMKDRLAALLKRGADKYGENNWQRGMPLSRAFGSALRHLILWALGDTKEDHLAAVVFNVMVLMFVEWQVIVGNMPREYGDAGVLKPQPTYTEFAHIMGDDDE